MIDGPVGRLGQKGREVLFPLFSLFKLFSNQTFSTQIQSKHFKLFSQNFINLLDLTQATINHALPNNDAQKLVISKLIKLSSIL
jgi:hypothetical protein